MAAQWCSWRAERFSGREEQSEARDGHTAESVRRAVGGVQVPVRAEIAGVHLPIEAVLALGLCAHAYGTYFLGEKDPWFDRMRARFRLEHAPLGDDVARRPARDQADVRRRLLVDPAQPRLGRVDRGNDVADDDIADVERRILAMGYRPHTIRGELRRHVELVVVVVAFELEGAKVRMASHPRHFERRVIESRMRLLRDHRDAACRAPRELT